MKKYFIFAAAAVTFAACTEDTLIDNTKAPENNNEVAIGFGSDVNKLVMTRAENSTATETQGLENYHSTFRIWGYKNIKNAPAAGSASTAATYKSTAVFDGTYDVAATDSKYANSVATWSLAADNDDPFNQTDANFGGGDWKYDPVRYWDKTAYNYDFHAAAPDKYYSVASGATEPDVIDWKWNQVMADGTSTWSDAAADARGAGYFKLGASDKLFSLAGESLPLANATVEATTPGGAPTYYNVTTQTDDVFGGKKGNVPETTGWGDKDVDLMIADDVIEIPANHSSSLNDRVTFHFNHILSRLNIGVKVGSQVSVKYDQQKVTINSSEYPLYEGASGTYYIKKGAGTTSDPYQAQKVTKGTDGSYSEDGTAVDWDDASYSKVDDQTKVLEGKVLLKDIEIVNLVTDGYFDEGVLTFPGLATKAMNGSTDKYVTPTDLSNGTFKRWTLGTTKTADKAKGTTTAPVTNNYGFPNEKVTGALDGEDDGAMNLSKAFSVTVGTGADAKTTGYAREDFKMVFQGLVIPQESKYESVAVDGSNTSYTYPYLKITYSLDGEEFTNYYNLASVFTGAENPYKNAEGYTVIKKNSSGDEYVLYKDSKFYTATGTDFTSLTAGSEITAANLYFVNGSTYYDSKWHVVSALPTGVEGTNYWTITLTSDNKFDYVLNKDQNADDFTKDISFNEGWQNNLWITINPTAILFDADVYKWETKYDSVNDGDNLDIE